MFDNDVTFGYRGNPIVVTLPCHGECRAQLCIMLIAHTSRDYCIFTKKK